MFKWKTKDLTNALNFISGGSSFFEAYGISIDTRTLKEGDIFVAIDGETFKGSDFLKDAIAKNAACFITTKEGLASLPIEILQNTSYFLVENTVQALLELGHYARTQTFAKAVAVTGSVGKTTTKEWLASILSEFGQTVKSPASYNNNLGVPLSLSLLDQQTKFGVFEIGMNHQGEIEPLTKAVAPDIAIITKIADAHVGQMESLDNIALEKSDIFKGIKPGGTAIINFDCPYFDFFCKKAKDCGAGKIISFGEKEGADVRLISSHVNYQTLNSQITISVFGQRIAYEMGVINHHFIINSLVVMAVVYALQLSLSQAAVKMVGLKPAFGRGQIHNLQIEPSSNIMLIDDSYNANPTSMVASINTVLKLCENANLEISIPPNNKRLVLIVGEMLELGTKSEDAHMELLPLLKQAGLVFTCGKNMRDVSDKLSTETLGGHYDPDKSTWEDFLGGILTQIKDGDIVLIKGSNGSGVFKIAKKLIESAENLLESRNVA